MGVVLEHKIKPFLFSVAIAVSVALFSGAETAHADAIIRAPNNLGLVGYWSFDEGRGTVLSDLSGGDNNGTFSGTPEWVVGRFKSGLEFDGTSDTVLVPSSDSVNFSNAELTISGWFKFPSSFSNERALLRKDNQYQLGFTNSSTIRNLIGTSGTTGWTGVNDISYSFETDTWYMLSMVYDGSTMTTYVNGEEVGEAVVTGSILTGGNNVGIGGGVRPFGGTVDELRLYNRALSETEVQSLYNSSSSTLVGRTPTEQYNDGLVAHWTFDGKHTTATTVSDIVGGNDGTISGATASPGVVGQAVAFDGVNDYIAVPDSPELRLGGAYTIAAWVNAKGGYSTGSIVSKRDFVAGSYRFRLDSDRIRWHGHYGGTTRTFDYGVNLQDGSWHYIVVTAEDEVDRVRITIYLDGVVGNSGTVPGLITGNTSPVDIGSLSGSQQQYRGLIDDVRIYNRALLPEEIHGLYTSTKPSSMTSSTDSLVTNGLVGHWTFDDETVSGTTVTDVSGNGKDGTINGTPGAIVSGKIGEAIEFDGTNGDVNLKNPLSSPDGWTYAFWFYPTAVPATDTAGLVGQGNNPRVTFQISRSVGTGATYQSNGNWAGGLNTPALTLNNWYHISAVWNDASSGTPTHQVYINGELAASRSYPAAINPPAATHLVNRRDSNTTLSGKIDDVRIYSRALTESEIGQLYSMGQ